MRKIIKKYRNASLDTCGSKEHKKGCYITLENGRVEYSREQICLLDFNKKGELVGVDLNV